MDDTASIQARLVDAAARSQPLAIQGNASKAFYGHAVDGEPLDVSTHTGIVQYEPTELVMRVRAGTRLLDINTALSEHDQHLAFDPPDFAGAATIGGTVASNLCGPGRPWHGAVRDHLLGATVLNGSGELLSFGGQVMKNVAGYDAFRLMAGALGTLGVLLDVSLKVLPRPKTVQTTVLELGADAALRRVRELAATPLPLSAACYHDGQLHLRFSGARPAVTAAIASAGGEAADNAFWTDLREHRLAFFTAPDPLLRIALPANTPYADIPGQAIIDWGGQQLWLRSEQALTTLRDDIAARGGHVTLYRGGDAATPVFQPLPQTLLAIHQRLKAAFDPQRILNPGRMYAEL